MDLDDLQLEKSRLKILYMIDAKKIDDQIKEKNREENKKLMLVLDILIIVAIVFNVGALLITNALIVKNNPEAKMFETNPAAAKDLNAKLHPDYLKIITQFIFHYIGVILLVFCYFYLRNNITSGYQKYVLIIFVLLIFGMLFFDFVNDLGYYVGILFFRH